MDRLEELRSEWHKASEKDRYEDAVTVLRELEELEPNEPRWSQRLGESYRRLGQSADAVDAFTRAFQRFYAQGFLPRAIAMAKLVKSLDAAKGDLIEASLPKGGVPPPLPFGRPMGGPAPNPTMTEATKTITKTVVKPPPLPMGDGPKPARRSGEQAAAAAPTPPPLPRKPAPLARAADAADGEVRFDDAPDSSVEILLVDFLNAATPIVVVDGYDDDDGPPTLDAPLRPEPRSALSSMASVRLFSSLSRDALVALSDASELVEFVPGAMIIVRNERAFALYAIVSGIARVTVPGSPEIRLEEGDIFGEGSLLDEGKRQADVRAESPLMTLRIEKRALDVVTKAHPEVESALFDLLARRLISNLMHTSPLFSVFEPHVRLELAQKFEVRRAAAGTVIAERGLRSDGLYILLAGNVMAEGEPDPGTGGPAPRRIARGTAFGHASLLGAGTADVTVRAATEAVLLRMPAAGFAALAALYPPALAHLADTAAEPLPMSQRE